jgi:hypothetical protein
LFGLSKLAIDNWREVRIVDRDFVSLIGPSSHSFNMNVRKIKFSEQTDVLPDVVQD